jgi:hypothetical protein
MMLHELQTNIHVTCLQAMIVRELFTLARNAEVDKTMPLFRTQQWFIFFISTFYLYGR